MRSATVDWVNDVSPDELDRDPYPIWARLREEAPIAYVPWADLHYLTRWDECAAVGGDGEAFQGASNHPTLNYVFGAPNIRTAAGEVHRDLRDSVDPMLRPRAVNGYIDDLVRPIARRHLDRIREQGRAEIMGEFLEPVSVESLGALLGLGVDPDTLRRWFHGLNVGASNVEGNPAKFAVSQQIAAEIEARLDPLLEKLAAEPDGSMLSHMLHGGRDGGPPRAPGLVYPTLKVILLGGMQEPGHAAGTTLHGLFTRPDQLARVVADHSLVPAAVTEGLRWIAPIGVVPRQATRDVVIAGVEIEAGQTIELVLGSANRDDRRFERPDEYDIDRTRQSHMAFGNGDHFCSGHYFSRQLERIALEELLTLPGLREDPDEEPVIRGWKFRAPKKLHVGWDA